MRRLCSAAVAALAFSVTVAQAQRLPWSSIDPKAATALRAFRQTDHWVAEALAENYDDERLGRDTEERPSINFDASLHLSYKVTSLRHGAPPAVFLLFEWSPVRGNGEAPGFVMQEIVTATRRSWHIACEFRDYGLSLTLLDRRSHGWRHFRVASGEYGWRPATGTPQAPLPEGAMECVPLVLTEFPP